MLRISDMLCKRNDIATVSLIINIYILQYQMFCDEAPVHNSPTLLNSQITFLFSSKEGNNLELFSLACILSLIQNSKYKYFFVARYTIYAFWVFHARSFLKMQFCDFMFSHFYLYFLINHTPPSQENSEYLITSYIWQILLRKKNEFQKSCLDLLEEITASYLNA